MDGELGDTPSVGPVKVGDKLRAARTALGMDLAEVAARTRVPLRHLQAIETSDYSGLPSPTYAVGFVRAYARAVGADEVALARELRAETAGSFAERPVYERYDPQDPIREPSSGLVWIGVIVAFILLLGVGIWYGTDWLRGGSSEPAPQPSASTSAVPVTATPPAPTSGGQVTLIATQAVWLRVYDADGKRLFEKEMAAGERYDVPDDAKGPMINVGRPESLQVTVNGSNVAPLGPAGRAVKDVPISAQALLARGSVGAPAPAATASPTPRITTRFREAAPTLPPAFAGNATAP